MRIDNGRYREVVMDWSEITPPLKAGTPISAAGAIANTSSAIGLVPVTVIAQNVMPRSIFIIDAGDVDLEEVETESGLTISADAKAAMPAIRFHHADGTVDDYASGGGSGGGGGMLLTVTAGDDANTLDKSWNEIVAAINRGTIPFFVYEDYGMVVSMVRAYGEGSTGDDATPWWISTSNGSNWQADEPDGTLTLQADEPDGSME